MEEPKCKYVDTAKNHFTTTLSSPSQPYPLPHPTSVPRRSNKNSNFSNTDYQSSFKIRALVQQLRPHVLEVLHTPDFRNCRAADEIRNKMKLLKDLDKKMTTETHKERKVVSENRHSSHKHRPLKEEQKRKQAELLPQPSRSMEKGLKRGNPSILTSLSSGKKRKLIDAGIQGSYIVGGSVFGLNFITVKGRKPVYYGLTKESYRSSHKK